MRTPAVIPLVMVNDLVLAALIALLYRAAPTRITRVLTAVAFLYVLVEAFMHVLMERLAAGLMRRWL